MKGIGFMRGVGLLALAGSLTTAGAAGLTEQEMSAARKLETGKCAKCHERYRPQNYQPAVWDHWLKRMARKSKLKPEQEDLLRRYAAELRAPAAP